MQNNYSPSQTCWQYKNALLTQRLSQLILFTLFVCIAHFTQANPGINGKFPSAAGLVTNESNSKTFTSIQAAINDADTQNGHTITVSAGTYNENLTINKSLTIKGAQFGVDPRPSTASSRTIGGANESIVTAAKNVIVVNITANNVVIDGFQFTHSGSSGAADAVKAASSQDNITISNNIITSAGDEAIQLEAGTNYTVSKNYIFNPVGDGVTYSSNNVSPLKGSNQKIVDNDITGSTSAYGSIYLYGTQNVEVAGNRITTLQSGISIGSEGLPVSNVVVHDNEVNTELRAQYSAYAIGIGIDDKGNNITIRNNKIIKTGSTTPSAAVKDRYNLIRVGVSSSSNPTNVSINKNYLERSEAENFIYVIPSVTNLVDATCNWYGTAVGSEVTSRIGGTGAISYVPYLDGGGDADAATGFTPTGVCSCANGTVTNTSKIFCTIQAAIDAPDTQNGHTLTVSAGTYNEQVTVSKSLTINGANVGTAGNATRAAESIVDGNNGAHGGFVITANNVTIDGFTVTGAAGTYGAGVYSSPNTSGFTLQNNIITDNVIGAYPSSNGASWVKNNLFNANNRTGAAGGSGIYVEATNSLTIENNEFKGHTNNSAIIFGANATNAHQNLVLTKNYFHDNNNSNSMVYLNGVTNGTISQNVVVQSGTTAIKVAGGNTGITITNNTLDGNTTSLKIQNDAIGPNTNVQAHNNSMVASSKSIDNLDAATVDATCNWYGSANAGDISGKISGPVTYTPFLNNGTDNESATPGFQPVPNSCGCANGTVTNTNTSKIFCSIQAAIDAPDTQDGHTITVSAGTYTENVTVNKSLTINGANVGVAGTGTRGTESILRDGTFNVTAANVLVDGFHVYQTNNTTPVSLASGSNATFQNSKIERVGVTAGQTLRGIEISAGSTTKTIKDNLFTGSTAGGLFGSHRTWNSAIYVNGTPGTINITGNTFENVRTALNLDDFSNTITISGNTFKTNGTHMSFGGVSPTTGSFVLGANEFKTPQSGIINLSNVTTAFRLDITSSTYNNQPFSTYSLADLFYIEYFMYHRGRDGRNGLVTYVAGNQYVNPSINPAPSGTTIQSAVNYGTTNDVIHVNDGTFNENVNVTKTVTIEGRSTDGTIIQGSGPSSGIGVNIQAADVVLKTFTAKNYNYGVVINASGTAHKLLNLKTTNNGIAGIAVPYSAENAAISNLEITNVTSTSNAEGLEVFATAAGSKVFDNVIIKNSNFSENTAKGIYIERANNLLIDNVTVAHSGYDLSNNSNNNGIDINLKYANYTGVTIKGSSVTNSGYQGSGGTAVDGPSAIAVKARDDASSYNTNPATLTNVLIQNNVVSGPENGIRIGEYGKTNTGPASVTVINNDLSAAFANKQFINRTNNDATLICNYHGSTDYSVVVSKLQAAGTGKNLLNSVATSNTYTTCVSPTGITLSVASSTVCTGSPINVTAAGLLASTPTQVSYQINNGSTQTYSGTTTGSGELAWSINSPLGSYTITVSGVESNSTVTTLNPPASVTAAVLNNAVAGTVSGSSPIAVGTTATYSNSGGTSGGIWSSSNPSVATVNSSGAVTGVASGTANIIYTVTGCSGSVTSQASVIVRDVDLVLVSQTSKTAIYGASSFTTTGTITNISVVPTHNTIIVSIAKDPKFDFVLDGSSSSSWTMVSMPNEYRLTSSAVISAGSSLTFQLNGNVTPNSTSGKLSFSTRILSGDTRTINNTSVEIIDYYAQ